MKRVLLLVAFCGSVFASGIMVPKETDIPPLAVEYLRVSIDIDGPSAATLVEQAFRNSTARPLEATFIFPVPKAAAITSFSMFMGDKEMKAEILDRDKARSIYEAIVARTRDPALLEFLDSGLLQARVFPVPASGIARIKLQYKEVLSTDGGLYRFVFPLRTGDRASSTLKDFTVVAKVHSDKPIKTIYSPTHRISVDRRGENDATIGFEQQQAALDKDFELYYTAATGDLGFALFPYRKGDEGTFLLIVAPKVELREKEVIDRDVVFVLDTSGSMAGEKIEQARKALKFCLNNLNPGDRFNIIRFSTEAEPYAPKPVPATKDEVKKATEFVEKMQAAGGTNIDAAMRLALSLRDEKRSFCVFFMTDGLPTVGELDPDQIVKNTLAAAGDKARIFCFGVGYDVNVNLLQAMAEGTRASLEFVKPEEDIEVKVSLLYQKVQSPVLSELALAIDGVKITEIYPKQLPDLFRGSQLTIVGRYQGEGKAKIKLTGVINNDRREFSYEGEFPKDSDKYAFVDPIWAHRKVGYLLDQLKKVGQNKELVDEVVRLSKAYGIVTPYTAALVTEDSRPVAMGADRDGRRADWGIAPPPPPGTPMPTEEAKAAPRLATPTGRASARTKAGDSGRLAVTAAPAGGLADAEAPQFGSPDRSSELKRQITNEVSGKDAVDFFLASQKLREGEKADEASVLPTKRVGEKSFVRVRGVWVDTAYKGGETVKIKFGSKAYFALARTELKSLLSVADRCLIVAKSGKAIEIGPEGKEELSEKEIEELLKERK